MSLPDHDAIVIGSGVTGGWAAKELCERGLRTLLLERGPDLMAKRLSKPPEPEPAPRRPVDGDPSPIQSRCWAHDERSRRYFVRDTELPFSTPEDAPFAWIRGHHLGGRSLIWSRQCLRLGPRDFRRSELDGKGIPWPITYADLAPWYSHVERFIGVSGEGGWCEAVPDGEYLPPFPLTSAERDMVSKVGERYPARRMSVGRVAVLSRPHRERPAYGWTDPTGRSAAERWSCFSSLSSTLPAAWRCGDRLDVLCNQAVHSLIYDPRTGQASGVRAINTRTGREEHHRARVIFLCASTLESTRILLCSTNPSSPKGLGNSSDTLGRFLMDHVYGPAATGTLSADGLQELPGPRPAILMVPPFRNVQRPEPGLGFTRSYIMSLYIDIYPTHGAVWLGGFGEMLPNAENRVQVSTSEVDAHGIPTLRIDCRFGPEEHRMAQDIATQAADMLRIAGCTSVEEQRPPLLPGLGVHEMGTARMGRDPSSSVLNGWNQCHEVPNVFVTDGACMPASPCQNPSLTYMALTARAANRAADLLAKGAL